MQSDCKIVHILLFIIWIVLFHKNLFHRFQITKSVEHVGQQITAFHPLIPRVNGNQLWLIGMTVGISFGFRQQSGKTFGCIVVVHHIVNPFCGKPRCVVLANGNTRKQWHIQNGVHLGTNFHGVITINQVVFVQSAHIVERHTVESHSINPFFKPCSCFLRHD